MSLEQLRAQLLEKEAANRTRIGIYAVKEKAKISFSNESSEDFIGFTQTKQKERAKEEFFALREAFMSIGLSFSYSRKSGTCYVGYKDKVIPFQKIGGKYYCISGQARLNVTNWVKMILQDSEKSEYYFVKHLRKASIQIFEDYYCLKEIFFNRWVFIKT